jgi:hypothetical protein
MLLFGLANLLGEHVWKMFLNYERFADILLLSKPQTENLKELRRMIFLSRQAKWKKTQIEWILKNHERIFEDSIRLFNITPFPYAHLFRVHAFKQTDNALPLGLFSGDVTEQVGAKLKDICRSHVNNGRGEVHYLLQVAKYYSIYRNTYLKYLWASPPKTHKRKIEDIIDIED